MDKDLKLLILLAFYGAATVAAFEAGFHVLVTAHMRGRRFSLYGLLILTAIVAIWLGSFLAIRRLLGIHT